ncbi:MAG: carboxylating nicotinate-nucleotide diphosphorylase [Ignavibacteriales bacterium]|nr:carboxylating nicotinate-nucleotide diphosphorylase [Ignavibacteriales bacterium]
MENNYLNDSRIGRLIEHALFEDIGFGDITSESLISEDQLGKAEFIAKESGIISGIDVVKIIFSIVDGQITFEPAVQDGSLVQSGVSIGSLHGPVRTMLTGERVALNFLQRMCGIATLTHKYVHAVAGTKAKITDTRKTVPGLRVLDKKAVMDGGGVNHRFALDSMVLIKDNHIAAAGGIRNAIARCKDYLRNQNIEVKIEIETTSVAQVTEVVATGGIDRIMLDNYSLEDMREAVKIIAGKFEIEASGGVNLQTVRQIAETGVDFISVGALTHSPKALDISLEYIS